MTFRAIRHARELARRNTPIPEGMCVQLVREAMDIHVGTGDQDGDGDADAHDAWRRAGDKHFLTGTDFRIPRGVPVFWRGPADRHGHLAVATGFGTGPDATVWSPGAPAAPTRWRKVRVRDISTGWNLDLVGYAYVLNGRPVPDVERG